MAQEVEQLPSIWKVKGSVLGPCSRSVLGQYKRERCSECLSDEHV